MKKGIIKLQISDVWEFLNKPSRVIIDIRKQVRDLPTDEYEYLDFCKETKKELIVKLDEILKTGKIF